MAARKTPTPQARIAFLLSAVGFSIVGWREHGWVFPVVGVVGGVVLASYVKLRARRRKAREKMGSS